MTSVKYFHSAISGAPTLNGTAGSLISTLDACLVNGFNVATIDSLTVAGGIATAYVSAGHTFEADCVVEVVGATPSGLSGQKRVLTAINLNYFTFDATGISDQTATGTITAKWAPMGWQKVYSATNLAVYRSQDITGTRAYLRVDDSSLTNARVVGYESMTDINTGSGPFPTTAQLSGGGYWPKASTSTPATARSWTIIGNAKAFYVHVNTAATTASVLNSGCVFGFGDFLSTKSGDAYGAFLSCAISDIASVSALQQTSLSYGNTTTEYTGTYIPRSYTGVGSSVIATHYTEGYVWNVGESGATANYMYPNGPDNGLILARKIVFENLVDVLRGRYPGILHCLQNCHANFAWRDKIAGQGDFAGRKLLVLKTGGTANTSSTGVTFFDITGPWS